MGQTNLHIFTDQWNTDMRFEPSLATQSARVTPLLQKAYSPFAIWLQNPG